MSDKYICSGDKLTGIGDAIRSKAGTSDKLTLDEMPSAIEGISGGSDIHEEIIYNQTEALYLDTSIDYFDGANVAFCISYNFSKTRYLLNGVITDDINICSMYTFTNPTFYIDTYNNQLSITNNNGKIRINSSTYKFAERKSYFIVVSNSLNIDTIESLATNNIFLTNIDYKYGYSYLIFPNSDISYNYTITNNSPFAIISSGINQYFVSKYDSSTFSSYFKETYATTDYVSEVSETYIHASKYSSNNPKVMISGSVKFINTKYIIIYW